MHLGWRSDSPGPEHNPNRNSQRADSGDTLRELSGCFCRRKYLFHGCRLLRANDPRTDVLETSGIDRTPSRVREFPDRDDSAHNCAARLSHPRAVDVAEAIQCTCDRSGRRLYFAVARADWSLVYLVVVRKLSVPLGNAGAVRDQSHSRSWNRARPAGSSIAGDLTRDDCDLCRMEPASRRGHWGSKQMEHR